MKNLNLAYVGGSKGGTGKSLFSMALVDYLRKTYPEDEILLIETDSSNPDVGRLYAGKDRIEIKGVLLDEEERGWVQMTDMIDDTNAKHVVINSMAASNLGIQAQGGLFEHSLNTLGAAFNVFWVMNRNKDSVTLLRDFLRFIKTAAVYPVLNLYFGKEEEFLFYGSNTDIQETIVDRKGHELIFPNLNDLIADKLYTEEIAFEDLPSQLKLGMRSSLERWLNMVQLILDDVYLPENPVSES